MSDLRTKLQKLASEKPELREKLRPIIAMRTASSKADLQWAADQIENALQMLEDVADVLDTGRPSLADDYREASEVANSLRRDISAKLDRHQKALEKIAR